MLNNDRLAELFSHLIKCVFGAPKMMALPSSYCL